jgi:regulator of sigma E protease
MNTFLTILISLIIFGMLIFVHEFGHFAAAKLNGVRVNEFAVGMGPVIWKKKKNGTLYSLRALPIGGFNSLEGEDEDSDSEGSFTKAPVSTRILIIISGALMNFIIGFIILLILTATSSAIASTTISYFYEGASTQASGLEVGDRIVSIDGRRMYTIDDVIYELARIQDGTADFVVERNGEKVEVDDVQFTTEYNEDAGYNTVIIDFKVYAKEKTVGNVIKESALWSVSVARSIFMSIIDLIAGRISVNQLSGPVGIVTVISESASMGLYYVAYLTAYIAINLAVCNLLPLPALDGGRLFFLLFEGIFRRKVNPKYEAYVHVAGFVLLMCLMLFVTFNDITKIFK